jgi:hypothetical protein
MIIITSGAIQPEPTGTPFRFKYFLEYAVPVHFGKICTKLTSFWAFLRLFFKIVTLAFRFKLHLNSTIINYQWFLISNLGTICNIFWIQNGNLKKYKKRMKRYLFAGVEPVPLSFYKSIQYQLIVIYKQTIFKKINQEML